MTSNPGMGMVVTFEYLFLTVNIQYIISYEVKIKKCILIYAQDIIFKHDKSLISAKITIFLKTSIM